MKKKTTRKLKFGSPAWQKKYNPTFGGKKKSKKVTKRTTKAAKRPTKKAKRASTKKTKSWSTINRERRPIQIALELADLCKFGPKKRIALAKMVEPCLPSPHRSEALMWLYPQARKEWSF